MAEDALTTQQTGDEEQTIVDAQAQSDDDTDDVQGHGGLFGAIDGIDDDVEGHALPRSVSSANVRSNAVAFHGDDDDVEGHGTV